MYNPYLYSMYHNQYRNSVNNHISSMPIKRVNNNPTNINNDKGFNLGEPAPEFTLKGIVDGVPKDVSLSDYLGKWVVVFFYGSDFTFV